KLNLSSAVTFSAIGVSAGSSRKLFIVVSPENQPRRNEEHEERMEKIFVFFVSSWLIFIISLGIDHRNVN
ncbi:MAG TPA: hypothetical protein VI479_17500, partial [Blastocatellia bacterium]